MYYLGYLVKMNFNFADEHKAHKRNVQNLKANFHLFSRDLIQEHIYFLRGKGRVIVFNLTSIELEFLIFRCHVPVMRTHGVLWSILMILIWIRPLIGVQKL